MIASPPLIQTPQRLEEVLQQLPPEPGVYLMRDDRQDILYIGKSKALRSRVRSYFREQATLSPRIALMVQQVREIEVIVTDTEAEALALEANLIKQHQPHFNTLLKDDKKYPYVCITWSEPYPRILITRKRSLGTPQDRYYGPYVDSHGLRQTLGLIHRLFPLRQRRKPLFRDRPCLNYDMGRCPGVCQHLITPEAYHKTLEKVAMIFQGRTQELEHLLQQQMTAAAENLQFEKAAQLRDQLRGLQSLGVEQKVALPDDTVSRDAIALAADGVYACIQLFQVRSGRLVGRLGFIADAQAADPGLLLQRILEAHYQQGDAVEIPSEILVQYPLPETEILSQYLTQKRGRKVEILVPQRQSKAELVALVQRNARHELTRIQRGADRQRQALEDLAQELELPCLPHRLEAYDISHLQGSDAVGSQVVFLDGLPAPQHYRRYQIKNPTVVPGHSDDFASLAEVLSRRFRDPDPENLPDVVLIDGGKGQLSAVMAALEALPGLESVQFLSLAKQREEVFLPGHSQPLHWDRDRPGVQLLRRLRDEAHRFAVTYHRQKRQDRQQRSRLGEIPGLGHTRQKELLAHFRSIDQIRLATPAQLAQVPGIGPKLAQQIHTYFHPSAP
jgi:excinuclease ABC subunit C